MAITTELEYDFKCIKCNFKFDIDKYSHEINIKFCPHCGTELY